MELETALQAEVARYRGEPLLTILNELTYRMGGWGGGGGERA